MKKALFTNIGNRNLLYKGDYIELYLKKNKIDKSFKTFTQQLLENFDQEKHNLSLAILNTLFEKIQEEIDEVILFSSLQQNVERTNQDTYYAGEILVKLLNSDYPKLNFSNFYFKSPVFDYNKLITEYKRYLYSFIQENPEKPVAFCDAGGTSQQKFASKIMLEYLYNSDMLNVYYISLDKQGESSLHKAEPYEYRKVIDKENVRIAIRTYAYDAALKILAGNNLNMRDKKEYKLLEFASLRSKLLIDEAQNKAKELSKMKKFQSLEFINNFANKKPIGAHELFEKFLSQEDFFILCEYLALARLNMDKENYSAAVLNLVQFQEMYCYFVIKELGYDLTSNSNREFQAELSRLEDNARKEFKSIANRYAEKNLPKGLPFYRDIARNIDDDINQKVLDIFYETSSERNAENNISGLNGLRNKYAHKGKTVKKEDLVNKPYYEKLLKIYDLLGISEYNVYDEMNDSIIHILQ